MCQGRVTWTVILKIAALLKTLVEKIQQAPSLQLLAAAKITARSDFAEWKKKWSHHQGLNELFQAALHDEHRSNEGDLGSRSFVTPSDKDVYVIGQLLSILLFHKGYYLVNNVTGE